MSPFLKHLEHAEKPRMAWGALLKPHRILDLSQWIHSDLLPRNCAEICSFIVESVFVDCNLGHNCIMTSAESGEMSSFVWCHNGCVIIHPPLPSHACIIPWFHYFFVCFSLVSFRWISTSDTLQRKIGCCLIQVYRSQVVSFRDNCLDGIHALSFMIFIQSCGIHLCKWMFYFTNNWAKLTCCGSK